MHEARMTRADVLTRDGTTGDRSGPIGFAECARLCRRLRDDCE